MNKVECAVCGDKEGPRELLEHIHAKHLGPYRHNYCCGLCSFVSTNADALLIHANDKRHLPLQMKVTARDYVNDLAEKIMRDSLEFASKRGVKRKLEESPGSPMPPGPTKACKLCQRDVSKSKSDFLQHITFYHWKAYLSCPFCEKTPHMWNDLLNHIRKKHKSKADRFTLEDTEDATQLQEKIRECFKKKHRHSKTQQEIQITFDSADEASSVSSRKSLSKTSPAQASEEPKVVCALCGMSAKSKSKHVTKHHLNGDSKIEMSHTTDAHYQMSRRCFPEEDADKCALCFKEIRSEMGKSFHTALFHHKKSLKCPYCSHRELHNWNINKHLKAAHPEAEYQRFPAPEQWAKALRDSIFLCFPRRNTESAHKAAYDEEAEPAASLELESTPTPVHQSVEREEDTTATQAKAAPEPKTPTEPQKPATPVVLQKPLTELQKIPKEDRNQPVVPPTSPNWVTTTRGPLLTAPPRARSSSESSRRCRSVPRSTDHGSRRESHERRTCQLCHEGINTFRGLERHVWVVHMKKEHSTYSCPNCRAGNHSVMFFRHRDQCPRPKLTPLVGYEVRQEFQTRFFSCFPWRYIRNLFEMSFQEGSPPVKD